MLCYYQTQFTLAVKKARDNSWKDNTAKTMRYIEVRVNSKYVKQTRRVNYLIEWGILESDNMDTV